MLAIAILFGYVSAFVVAAICDVSRYQIPNEVALSLLALFVLACFAYPEMFEWRSNAITGLAVFAVGTAAFFFGWLGAGDAKLMALAALWVGIEGLAVWSFTLAVAGLVLTFVLLVMRHVYARSKATGDTRPDLPRILRKGAPVPYGVAIAIAALGAMTTSSSLVLLWKHAAQVI